MSYPILSRYRDVACNFLHDEDGAVMTEYVIMVTIFVVASIWLSKASDALLFGENPYYLYETDDGNEALDAQLDETTVGSWVEITGEGTGTWNQNRASENAYLGQVSIHLARP